MDSTTILWTTAIIVVALAVYLLPGIIAEERRHRERRAILALNLLLGWTFIGWCIAIVWALTSNVEPLSVAGPGLLRRIGDRLSRPEP